MPQLRQDGYPDPSHRLVFLGTFIDLPRIPSEPATPTTAPKHTLNVRTGALWVRDGVIEGYDWDVRAETLPTFLQRTGWPPGSYTVVQPPADNRSKDINSSSSSSGSGRFFFFPGFIDTHIHAPQYPNTGIFGTSTLLDWLHRYTFPLESSLVDMTTARHIYARTVDRTLAHGTTTAAYYATTHVGATNALTDECAARGQRALIGRVCMDSAAICPDYYRDESAEASVDLTRETVAHIRRVDPQGRRINPVVTPRFAPSCSSAALRALADFAAEAKPPLHIQTHMSETKAEIELVRSLFPPAEEAECDGQEQSDKAQSRVQGNKKPKTNHSSASCSRHPPIPSKKWSYPAVYAAHNLLTPRTILAHAVHVSPADRNLLRASGSGVSHCPASNSALGSGMARVRALLDAGVAVGLGSDVSGGWRASVLEATRQACLVSRLVGFSMNSQEEEEEEEGEGKGKEKNDEQGQKQKQQEQQERKQLRLASCQNGRQKLSVFEALYLATRGGADVLKMNQPQVLPASSAPSSAATIGTTAVSTLSTPSPSSASQALVAGAAPVGLGGFDIGCAWDAQLIDLGTPEPRPGPQLESMLNLGQVGAEKAGSRSNVELFGWEGWEEKVEKWVWNGDERNVRAVWVDGKLVHGGV